MLLVHAPPTALLLFLAAIHRGMAGARKGPIIKEEMGNRSLSRQVGEWMGRIGKG